MVDIAWIEYFLETFNFHEGIIFFTSFINETVMEPKYCYRRLYIVICFHAEQLQH